MAFKIPQSMQGPSVDQQQLYQALANILSHDHVGQWGGDHLQEPKSLNGWNASKLTESAESNVRTSPASEKDRVNLRRCS